MTKQPEGKLSAKIRQLMIGRGAYVWKVHGNEYTPAGLPDLCGVYRGLFVGVESKMIDGHGLSRIQIYRIRQIQRAGGFVAAPCLSVERARQFLDDVDNFLAGMDGAIERMDREYGRLWSPDGR